MSEGFKLYNFSKIVSDSIVHKAVGELANSHNLDEYIQVLRLETILTLYENCVRDASEADRIPLDNTDIVRIIANEIVRRYLIGLPKLQNLAALERFLELDFPDDPLTYCIPDMMESFETSANWFEEEQIFLQKLKEIPIGTQFRSPISRVISLFQPDIFNFTNIMVTVDKEKDVDEEQKKCFDFPRFINEHMVDALIRRVSILRVLAGDHIFPQEVSLGQDFKIAARKAQEYLIASGKVSISEQPKRYDFSDDLAYYSNLIHDGRSAGMALAYLAYSFHKSLDNRFAPYIAICGSLSASCYVDQVASIEEKVQTAKENGIRVVVLPEANMAQTKKTDGLEFIAYPSGNLGEVIDHIQPIIDGLHRQYLGPKEALFWDDFIEKSKRQSEPILDKAKHNSRYNPDRYVSRNKIESEFESFIKDNDRNCMIIAGESGSGKTYFLCNLCDRSINDGNIVLFLDGEAMVSDKTIEESIYNLKPTELSIDSEEFIGIVNDSAQWKGRYFIISLDAIDKAENIGPKKALEAVEDLMRSLRRISSERIRIFLSCRNEIWKKLLGFYNYCESKGKYYASIKDGGYVELNLFTADERNEALEVYFGPRAKKLSERSKEMLRDPFMLRLAMDAYRDDDLPRDILSWTLIDKYYETCIPEGNRQIIVELLAEQMLLQKTDRISEANPGDDQLKELLLSEDTAKLIEERVLSEEQKEYNRYFRFPHDRFAEIHLARILVKQSDLMSREKIVDSLKRVTEFPHIWGALKLVFIKKWDTDLIIDLLSEEQKEINEFLSIAIITIGREDKPKALETLDRIAQNPSPMAKMLALDIAYNLGEIGPLRQAIYEPNKEINATAIQYLYLLSKRDASSVLKALQEICADISLSKMVTRRGRKALNAAMPLILLMLSYHFDEQNIRDTLREKASEAINRLVRIEKSRAMKLIPIVAIRFLNKISGFSHKEDVDPGLSPPELGHFFKIDAKYRRMLIDTLPYLKCEKLDIEAITDLLIEASDQREVALNLHVANILSAQSTVEGHLEKVLEVADRICAESNDHNKYMAVIWGIHGATVTLFSLKSPVWEECYEGYRKILAQAIDETKGRFTLQKGWYDLPLLSEYYLTTTELYGKDETDFISNFVEEALNSKNEDRRFLQWILKNLTDIAIMSDFGAVRSDIQKIIAEASDLIPEDIVNALTNLKVHYPEEIYDILDSLEEDIVKKHKTKIKGNKSKNLETLPRQVGRASGNMLRYVIRTPDMRNIYAEAWEDAIYCRNFGQWAERIFKRMINIVMNREIYRLAQSDNKS